MKNKKLFILGVFMLIGGTAIGALMFSSSEARCANCFTGQCYNSYACGMNCKCIKRGLDVYGHCYSEN